MLVWSRIRIGLVFKGDYGVAVVTAKHDGVGNGFATGEAYGGELRESKAGGGDEDAISRVILSSMSASTTKVGKERVNQGPSENWEQPA